MTAKPRPYLLSGIAVAALLALGAVAFDNPLEATLQERSQAVAQAPDFQGIDNWFNSPPLAMAELRGKVVLVDFWTYDCINCLNHLPYVKDWHARYKDQGLVVVGVHSPEFAYEKSTKNVRDAIARLKIEHAVAQDNGHKTWNAFRNAYWPAVYLVDKSGRVVYSHFGEGSYARTESKLRELLAETPATGAGA